MSNISDPLVAGDPVTIGGPMRGVHEVVLDARLRPVPVGVAGELYLAGSRLGARLPPRAGLTADGSSPTPFGAPGERMYRTGDLVRWSGATGSWSTSAAPTSRSRSAASASNSARSRRCCWRTSRWRRRW